MANKDWWESFSASDCLKIGSWEDMTEYIQHSACTDFTIYSECTVDGQAFRFTNNGTLSMLIGGSDAGDNLGIYANDSEYCASIKLYGDGDIISKIKAASTFEVSTCSDETLFEIDSAAGDHHVDFHCLDAHNFVLENRTTDPSSPTCIGQIWFRTDLV